MIRDVAPGGNPCYPSGFRVIFQRGFANDERYPRWVEDKPFCVGGIEGKGMVCPRRPHSQRTLVVEKFINGSRRYLGVVKYQSSTENVLKESVPYLLLLKSTLDCLSSKLTLSKSPFSRCPLHGLLSSVF